MILPNVDTRPTYEAMKRGEWPKPNPEVAAAWRRLRNLELPVAPSRDAKEHERKRRNRGEGTA